MPSDIASHRPTARNLVIDSGAIATPFHRLSSASILSPAPEWDIVLSFRCVARQRTERCVSHCAGRAVPSGFMFNGLTIKAKDVPTAVRATYKYSTRHTDSIATHN